MVHGSISFFELYEPYLISDYETSQWRTLDRNCEPSGWAFGPYFGWANLRQYELLEEKKKL